MRGEHTFATLFHRYLRCKPPRWSRTPQRPCPYASTMTWITEQNRRWWVVVAMTVVMLPLTIDGFGFVVALPTIASDLKAGTSDLAWILNIAMLFFGAATMVMGRLADILGRRRVLIGGIGLMTLASIGCALAPSVGFLTFMRGVEGLSMGTLYGASFPIVANSFPPEQRSTGIGLWAAGFLTGNVFGSPLAGWLSSSISWRAIFWVNLPLMALGLLLTLAAVKDSRDPTVSRHIDWFGCAAPVVGFLALLYALQQANSLGWSAPSIIAGFCIATVVLGLFFAIEPRLKEPLIDFGLFRHRNYASACGVAFLNNVCFGALLFFTPLLLEVALGLSPITAGVILMAASVPQFLVSLFAGPLVDRSGARFVMITGMAALSIAFLIYTLMGPTSGLNWVVPALLIAGIGIGFAFNGSNISGVQSIAEERAGMASGVLSELRLLGNVIGVSVPLVLFNTLSNDKLTNIVGSHHSSLTATQLHEVRGLLAGSESAEAKLSSFAPSLTHEIDSVVREAFAAGMRGAMALVTLAAVLGVAAAMATRRRRRRVS